MIPYLLFAICYSSSFLFAKLPYDLFECYMSWPGEYIYNSEKVDEIQVTSGFQLFKLNFSVIQPSWINDFGLH